MGFEEFESMVLSAFKGIALDGCQHDNWVYSLGKCDVFCWGLGNYSVVIV